MKQFFDSKDLLLMVDRLAKRYNVLPSEILCRRSIFEFNLNVAVMLRAELAEGEGRKTKQTTKDLGKFKIDRKVIKKGKKHGG